MKTIYKFKLNKAKETLIDIPATAEILSAQNQFATPCIWVKLDTEEVSTVRRIVIYGTGHEIIEDNLIFIDTIQVHGGNFIFHVFEDHGYKYIEMPTLIGV